MQFKVGDHVDHLSRHLGSGRVTYGPLATDLAHADGLLTYVVLWEVTGYERPTLASDLTPAPMFHQGETVRRSNGGSTSGVVQAGPFDGPTETFWVVRSNFDGRDRSWPEDGMRKSEL